MSPSPPLSPWFFKELPKILHGLIADYLSLRSVQTMMATSQWGLEVYGDTVEAILLRPPWVRHPHPHQLDTTPDTVYSILDNRPHLQRLEIASMQGYDPLFTSKVIDGLAAASYWCCKDLEELIIHQCHPCQGLRNLWSRVQSGHFPKLKTLYTPMDTEFRPPDRKGLSRIGSYKPGPWNGGLPRLLQSISPDVIEELYMDAIDHECNSSDEHILINYLLMTEFPRLRVYRGQLGDFTMKLLSDHAPYLVSLQVILVEDESIKVITKALSKNKWPHLRELRIRNGAYIQDHSAYQNLACVLGNLPLQSLSFEDVRMPEYLVNANLFQQHLVKFSSFDSLDHSTASILGECLPKAPGLKHLTLAYKMIGIQCMEKITNRLKTGVCPKLEYLDLSSCECLGDEGIDLITDAIQHGCVALRHLNVSNCDVTGTGVQAIISTMPQLETLDLSNNSIGLQGATCLGEAFDKGDRLRRLRSLNLRDSIKKKHIMILAPHLGKSKSLEYVCLAAGRVPADTISLVYDLCGERITLDFSTMTGMKNPWTIVT